MAPTTSDKPTKKATKPTTKKASDQKEKKSSRQMSDEIASDDELASSSPQKTSRKRERSPADGDKTEESDTKKARTLPEIDFNKFMKKTKDSVVSKAIEEVFKDDGVESKHELPAIVKTYFERPLQYPVPEKASEAVEKRIQKLNTDNRARMVTTHQNEEEKEEFVKINHMVRRLTIEHLTHLDKVGGLDLEYEAVIKRKDGSEITVTKSGLQISGNAIKEITDYVSNLLVDLLHGSKQIMANRGVSSLSLNDVETALNVAFPLKQCINYTEDLTKHNNITDPTKSVYDIKRALKDGNANRRASRLQTLENDISFRQSKHLYLPEAHLTHLARKAVKINTETAEVA